MELSRRKFLVGIVALAGGMAVSGCANASAKVSIRRLRMYNTNTKESIDVVYWKNGMYSRMALRRISYFWRDHRQGRPSPIDIKLVNLIWAIERRVSKGQGVIHVNSAYRTHKTNEVIKKQGYKPAKNSKHLDGAAIDFYIPGYKASHLAKVAREFKAGGVGYYPNSNFIHVDTGPVRNW